MSSCRTGWTTKLQLTDCEANLAISRANIPPASSHELESQLLRSFIRNINKSMAVKISVEKNVHLACYSSDSGVQEKL